MSFTLDWQLFFSHSIVNVFSPDWFHPPAFPTRVKRIIQSNRVERGCCCSAKDLSIVFIFEQPFNSWSRNLQIKLFILYLWQHGCHGKHWTSDVWFIVLDLTGWMKEVVLTGCRDGISLWQTQTLNAHFMGGSPMCTHIFTAGPQSSGFQGWALF